ncbi:hypothetical protein EON63_07375 [archaeon]|nr:MAG: hypothetical protein EON63_07375 [archaeon]
MHGMNLCLCIHTCHARHPSHPHQTRNREAARMLDERADGYVTYCAMAKLNVTEKCTCMVCIYLVCIVCAYSHTYSYQVIHLHANTYVCAIF